MQLLQFIEENKEKLEDLLGKDNYVTLRIYFYNYKSEGTWETISLLEFLNEDHFPRMARFQQYPKELIYVRELIFNISENIKLTIVLKLEDGSLEVKYITPNIEIIKNNIQKTKKYF